MAVAALANFTRTGGLSTAADSWREPR
jgi:hypothetical protein